MGRRYRQPAAPWLPRGRGRGRGHRRLRMTSTLSLLKATRKVARAWSVCQHVLGAGAGGALFWRVPSFEGRVPISFRNAVGVYRERLVHLPIA